MVAYEWHVVHSGLSWDLPGFDPATALPIAPSAMVEGVYRFPWLLVVHGMRESQAAHVAIDGPGCSSCTTKREAILPKQCVQLRDLHYSLCMFSKQSEELGCPLCLHSREGGGGSRSKLVAWWGAHAVCPPCLQSRSWTAVMYIIHWNWITTEQFRVKLTNDGLQIGDQI